MSESRRLVISGYYGFGNLGDEAVLAGLVDTFRAAIPNVSLAVASSNPEATRQLHGVEAFNRFSLREFRDNLRACDAFISGGGSLFQDVTSRRSIYYYLGTLALARFCRRPVMICGQGVGPVLAAPARALTSLLFNRARLITVRDPASLETLKELGVTRPPMHVTADPVFALQPSPPATADAILSREGVDGERPRVAFAVRAWPPAGPTEEPRNSPLARAVAEAVAFTHRELGAQPVLVPMHPPADVEFARGVAALSGVPAAVLAGGYSPRDAVALFGRMDLVVGMRLHALIFAAVQGTPLVGITYDPKVESFLRLLNRTPAAEAASIRGEALNAAIQHAWSIRDTESRRLREQAALLREQALRNGTLLASLLADR